MSKDYYLVLGVAPDATQDEIRSAYRRLAKKCHPDCSGEGSEPFQAIGEAYEVLSDPRRRRAYDTELAREKKRLDQMSSETRSEPLRQRRYPVEPLVPTRRPSSRRDPFARPSLSSLMDELFRSPWGDLEAPSRFGTGGIGGEEIHAQISLTREEALRGGRLRVRVPVETRCPACWGCGQFGFLDCPQCFGSGLTVDEYPVEIPFPGGLVDGSRARVSLDRPDQDDLVLTLHFKVREW
jgi:DnaJ-class molecular chaperone